MNEISAFIDSHDNLRVLGNLTSHIEVRITSKSIQVLKSTNENRLWHICKIVILYERMHSRINPEIKQNFNSQSVLFILPSKRNVFFVSLKRNRFILFLTRVQWFQAK